MGPITAGMISAGNRYSGSRRPWARLVMDEEIRSISLPPKNIASAAPMKPEMESNPKPPMGQLYGAAVNVREEVN